MVNRGSDSLNQSLCFNKAVPGEYDYRRYVQISSR